MTPETTLEGTVLTIDFGRPEANWSIVVIDDLWDAVRMFTLGLYDPANHGFKGGEEDFLSPEAVERHWRKPGQPSEEFNEKSLLFLPWVFHEITTVRRIVFTPFPDSIEEMRTIYLRAADAGDRTLQVACLIDISDESGKVRLPETWDFLKKIGHLSVATAKFSRLSKNDDVHDIVSVIAKVPIPTLLRRELTDWFKGVTGTPISDVFRRATEGDSPDSCHNPTDLVGTKSSKARRSVCDKLILHDQCAGVWRWAAELAAADELDMLAPRRWNCAKGFQSIETGYKGEKGFPLGAVIAVCSGAPFLQTRLGSGYRVVSPIAEIPDDQIDSLFCLGRIVTRHGTYGDFVTALRDWIVQPEQFLPGHHALQSVAIASGEAVTIEFTYDGPLPASIFAKEAARNGRTRSFWQRLRSFATDHAVDGAKVRLNFGFKP